MRIEWSEKENRDVGVNPCCEAMDKMHKVTYWKDPVIDSDWTISYVDGFLGDGKDIFIVNFCPWCGTKIDKESQ